MRHCKFVLALSFAAAMPLAAQQPFLPVEIGVLGQWTKFADVTKLDNAFGFGGMISIPLVKRIAFQYEADYGKTKSTRVGDLTALNNRFDLLYYIPWARHSLFLGGGWTGSRYKTDTTHNQYDSGGNAQVGVRWCMGDNWALRTSGVMDFKDPSDQTPTGDRTQTLSLRLGISRFFGGKGGVGKTVSAGVTAQWVASQGKRTLLASTNPVHSLSGLLSQDVFGKHTAVTGVPNLWAYEIDTKDTIERSKVEIREKIQWFLKFADINNSPRLLVTPVTLLGVGWSRLFFARAGRRLDSAPRGELLKTAVRGAAVLGGLIVLFCVGAMAVIGSIKDGTGDPSVLYIKALLDGIASIVLATTLGAGVGLSVIPLFFVYQLVVQRVVVSLVMAVIMLVAGFLFAAVAGYMAGLVGSSNNPISGVTISTILFASLVLLVAATAGITYIATSRSLQPSPRTVAVVAADRLGPRVRREETQPGGQVPRHRDLHRVVARVGIVRECLVHPVVLRIRPTRRRVEAR